MAQISVFVRFLDASKAFDRVNHSTLGVRGGAFQDIYCEY